MRTRRAWGAILIAAVPAAGAGCTSDTSSSGPGTTAAAVGGAAPSAPPGSTASVDPEKAAAIEELVAAFMDERHLKAVIMKVTVDGETVLEQAWGESMTGVPATTDMRTRNGAIAISYVSTLLLILVDEGVLSLDDKVSEHLPDMAHADQITVGQLARMTSGYQDYVQNPELQEGVQAEPFRIWSTEDQVRMGADLPLSYEPGTNWSYAHTNYVVLGLVLEAVTGEKMEDLLADRVLGPMGLTDTQASLTAAIPEPALHAYSAERKTYLGIPETTRFLEETTTWSPSWTINHGAIQTSTIDDFDRSAIAIGEGTLLSPESHQAMIGTDLRGFGQPQDPSTCPTCATQTEFYSYGIGLVTTGDWVMQNPLFYGYAGLMAYLPSQGVAISIAATYDEEAFGPDGAPPRRNQAQALFLDVGAIMAPDAAPPRFPEEASSGT
jgi:CubicO group peptidase (beta-lactamase class C family)